MRETAAANAEGGCVEFTLFTYASILLAEGRRTAYFSFVKSGGNCSPLTSNQSCSHGGIAYCHTTAATQQWAENLRDVQ